MREKGEKNRPGEMLTQDLFQLYVELPMESESVIDKLTEADGNILKAIGKAVEERISWIEMGKFDPTETEEQITKVGKEYQPEIESDGVQFSIDLMYMRSRVWLARSVAIHRMENFDSGDISVDQLQVSSSKAAHRLMLVGVLSGSKNIEFTDFLHKSLHNAGLYSEANLLNRLAFGS